MKLLCLSLGGAFGAMFRYILGLYIMKRSTHSVIPIAMIIVNVIGSMGLGVFYAFYIQGLSSITLYQEPLFLSVGVGFFGAFTTYSTFSTEAVGLLRRKQMDKFFLYISLSIIGSIVMFSLGYCLFSLSSI